MRHSPMHPSSMRPLPMPAEPEDETAEVVPKQRRCLRCETAFQSAWAGERICGRCKGSSAWRQGSPLPNH